MVIKDPTVAMWAKLRWALKAQRFTGRFGFRIPNPSATETQNSPFWAPPGQHIGSKSIQNDLVHLAALVEP
jgi:hypothetical protein